MIERFVRIQKAVRLALLEMGSDIVISDDEIEALKQLIQILEPARYAVDALCRRDATLLTAERINGVVFKRLEKVIKEHPQNILAAEFYESLKNRIESRRNDTVIHLMEYLKDSSYFKKLKTDSFGKTPKKNKVIDLATELLDRLFGIDIDMSEDSRGQKETERSHKRKSCGNAKQTDDENPDDPLPQAEEIEMSVQEEIEIAIQSVSDNTSNENMTEECSMSKKQVRKEFEVFEESRHRTQNLSRLWYALNAIQPTSVESERAFSAAGLYLTKLRTRLKPSTTNALCVLGHYLKTQKKIEECKKANWNPTLITLN